MTTSAIKTLARTRAGAAPWGQEPEALKEYNEAREALNERARREWRNPEFHREVAADIEEVVEYGFLSESLFPSYFNVEQVGEFDRVTIRERRGLK